MDITPEFQSQINLVAFPSHPHCRVCKVGEDDLALRDELIARLVSGQKRKEVLLWLKSRGHAVSYSALCNHYNAHIEPRIRPLLEIRKQLEEERTAAEGMSTDEMIEAMNRNLLRQTLSASTRLQLELIVMAIREPGDAIEFLDKAAKLLRAQADMKRAYSSADLNEEMLQLRRLEMLQRQGDIDALVERYIRGILASHADVADRVMDILHPHLPTTATALTLALTDGSPDGTKNSKRPRKPRQ